MIHVLNSFHLNEKCEIFEIVEMISVAAPAFS